MHDPNQVQNQTSGTNPLDSGKAGQWKIKIPTAAS